MALPWPAASGRSTRRSMAKPSVPCRKAMRRSSRPHSPPLRPLFHEWSATSIEDRAAALERAGDLIEKNRGRLIALLQKEGGKTIDDCVSEVREAADYCRYYASEARRTLASRRCRVRPARATSCACAAAACSFVSARGISRWRFSSGRLQVRSLPEIALWPSPPSRRRLSHSRR